MSEFGTFIGIVLAALGFIVTIAAQTKINSSYEKYKKEKNEKQLCGQEVARKILDANGLENIHVVEVQGTLTDHYDPSNKVIRLSTDIFHGESVASMSVAAHECGHALQDKDRDGLFRFRSRIVPIVNFVTYAGYIVMAISLLLGAMTYFKAGILILMATLVFQLVTLPVEFDASERAKNQLKQLNLTSPKEDEGVKDMLFAAALTYVAGVITTIFQILRMWLMSRDRRS